MISKLIGKISRFGVQTIYLQTDSIEFEVHTPLNVIEYLQNHYKKNQTIHLYIYHHFQGEEQKLFGFLSFSQRELFRAIIQLKGIGVSLGLSILSHLNTKQLLDICERQDIKTLQKIPKVGKRIAEELIFEVNRKRKLFLKLLESTDVSIRKELSSFYDMEEVIQGLKYLGYREKRIMSVIEDIRKRNKELPQNTSEWIREVLKEI